MKTPRFLRSDRPRIEAALLAALGLTILPAALAPAAHAGSAAADYAEWDARKAAFFDAHPEFKTEREQGTGWEPYNRIKWLTEPRMVGGEENPAGARWNAWLAMREMQREQASASKSASATWFSLGPSNLSGRVLDVRFDPTNTNIVYVGSAGGGLWKSTNGGSAWTPMTDELPSLAVNAIAVLPSNPSIVLIGTGEGTNNIAAIAGVGILKSTDGGVTWNTTSLTYTQSQGHGFHVMEVSPANEAILAAASDGVWRSTDQGDNWTKIRSGEWTDIKWKPGGADSVFMMRVRDATTQGGLKLSADGGLTSVSLTTGLPSGLVIGKSKIGVSAANSNVVYLGIADYSTNEMQGFYRSTDGGQTWALRATSPNIYGQQGWYNNSLVGDPNNADRVIAGGIDVWRSTNGGTTWAPIGGGVHVDHHAAIYRPGTNDNLWLGSDGGVWESTNDGSSWTDRNAGLVTYQFYDICVSPPDPLRSWGGTQDQGTDRWVGSTTWLQGLFADGMVCNGHPTDPNTVYAEIQFGEHYKSTNGGANWFDINNGISGGAPWVTPVAIDPNDGDHLYTMSSDGIWRTLDGGTTWANVDVLGAKSISISPVSSNVVWYLAQTVVKISTDDGATWTQTSPFPFTISGGTDIVAHPTDVNSAIVAFGGYTGVSHAGFTTDLGATWQDVTGNLPAIPATAVEIDPQNTGLWFLGTDLGVWATTTAGAVWAPYEIGLPNTVIVDLEIQNSARKLVAGTHGRGMWEIDISSPPSTGVPGGVAGGAINLMLDPPYPNPFRGATALRYAAREPGRELSLSVYDVQGRLVEVLARHPADGIVREIRWSPKGGAGVYLAMLRAGAGEKSRKLIVVD